MANREAVLARIAAAVKHRRPGQILMVPELISHDTERRLCSAAGDSCSRYAEVLTFTRLAVRVAEADRFALEQSLDNGGRVVAMAAASRELAGMLKAYASVETRPEFLTELINAVDEFKRCCISPDDLLQAASRTQGTLAQKLEELSLLLRSYDALCAQGKRDPRDQMNLLLNHLEESSFPKEHTFYIDGFPDFTRQHLEILACLIRQSPDVTVSLNCDRVNSQAVAFEKPAQTAAQVLRCAKEAGIPYEIEIVAPRQDALTSLRENLFQGRILPEIPVHLIRAESSYRECVAAAERVMELVQSGCRYRDISLVCTDTATYRPLLSLVFHRCGIPLYISGTDDIMDKSVVATVLSAMDAACGGLEQREVLRYLRSVLSPLEPETCDRVENYAILWGIRGAKWQTEWTSHPEGLDGEWNDAAKEELERLNSARKLAVEPLVRLRQKLANTNCLRQQVLAVYDFLVEINLEQRLLDLARQMDEAGDNRSAQELNQLWEILLTAMEQLVDVLGDTAWSTEVFVRLFRLLLGQYDVGTIPPVLDAVTAGGVSAMRCQQCDHLILLGAVEGMLPTYAGVKGVLTDAERTELRNLGVPLTGGAMDGLATEFSEIYGVFCGASKSVTLSYPGGQSAFLFRRMAEVLPEQTPGELLGAALSDPWEAGAYLASRGQKGAAKELGLEAAYDQVWARANFDLGLVQREQIEGLYGKKLLLSASQIDRQADCRLHYFLQYGLRAKERKEATIDPAEFGTYVHAVLEQTCRKIRDMGGFHNISLSETLTIAREFADAYAEERFRELDNDRVSYLFRRNGTELELVVKELWQELHAIAFEPEAFELGFGVEQGLPAVLVPGKTMDASLRGYVDRVDVLKNSSFFRVVDYKTGRKDFDYCDVFNGIGLQMLLYLFALEGQGSSVLGGRTVPAGVQYFPARMPVISAQGRDDSDQIGKDRVKQIKRHGLMLADDQVIAASDPDGDQRRLSCKYNSSGVLVGDVADRDQMKLLKNYVFSTVGRLVDEIASGNVSPNPYTRGSYHNACSFCPYSAVCGLNREKERRNYKTMDSSRFWQDVEAEVKRNG